MRRDPEQFKPWPQAATHDDLGSHRHHLWMEGRPMNPEEMIALAEKYEAWIGGGMPECLAREYRAIAEGLRLLAVSRPDQTLSEGK